MEFFITDDFTQKKINPKRNIYTLSRDRGYTLSVSRHPNGLFLLAVIGTRTGKTSLLSPIQKGSAQRNGDQEFIRFSFKVPYTADEFTLDLFHTQRKILCNGNGNSKNLQSYSFLELLSGTLSSLKKSRMVLQKNQFAC